MKLLLVDANAAYAQQLRGDLLRSGAMLCELEIVTSQSEAAAQLAKERFDAILIDPVSLHDVSASVYLDLQPLAPRAPILVLADEDDDSLAVDAVREGAHDFLVKSHIQPDWLLRRVRYAIDRQRGAIARTQLAGPHASQRRHGQVGQLATASHATSARAETGSVATAEQQPSETAVVNREMAGSVGDALSSAATPRTNRWRVLHVEDDPVFITTSEELLRRESPFPLDVTHAGTLSEVTQELASSSYDAVLLDLSLPDSWGLETLAAVLRKAGETPVLVVTAIEEAKTAIDGVRNGAEDFLNKSEPNLSYLQRATQLAIVRRDRTLRNPPTAAAKETPPPANPTPVATPELAPVTAAAAAERRRHARYVLTKPIFATPVLPDGSPAATYSADGFSVDVSEGGLRFEIGNLQKLPTTHLLVGIEGLDTVLHFATVEARHVVPKGNGLDVGAQFAKGPRDLIRKENLEPTFNPATCRYETGLPLEVIMKWVDFGIFRPALFDRTFVCPQCRAIPTFRNGCRVCGSVRLHSRPLIHHFACAHVGFVSDFEQDGAIVCPKCRTRNLIVGADFEHLNGPYHCLDCDWSDTELDTVGQCMKCELRFPMQQAIEEDLIGYHVNRLDPLAFINAG